MIGFLKGTLIDKKLPEIWLLCGSVGYRVRVGERVGGKLHLDQEISLYIHTAVREDALDLYGFLDRQELHLFELILSVSGIGPKIGLAVLGTRTVSQVEEAVRKADVAFFTKINGIGKKGAQRLIVDLKGKLPSETDLDLSDDDGTGDAVAEALLQFGFTRPEVLTALKKVDPELSEAEKIRWSLKHLGRR